MLNPKPIRRREPQLAFEALAIEGALLSPDWLAKAAQLKAPLQADADYRIEKGLNLRDEIARSFRIAQAHFRDFSLGRSKVSQDHSRLVLSVRFVSALLKKSLGFDSLEPVPIPDLQGRAFDIGHAALAGRVPVVIAPAALGIDSPLPLFADGTRRRSAFGIAQEFLNAAPHALWGICSDGLRLRILRDNQSLTRPAWIEADLERIFTEERYADFSALWLLAHESRFGHAGDSSTSCILEQWRILGQEEGTRAREFLRRGVEEALVSLGQGFLAHPHNRPLRDALFQGKLSVTAYFQQLLRLVYRMIFLLTAEERALLHPEDIPDPIRRLYAQGYGMRRLRDSSVRRSAHDRHYDLWISLRIVFKALEQGEPLLGLPALGGLFEPGQCQDLQGSTLENRFLSGAVLKLSWLREHSGLSRVNWRDMGSEELGSVYESLLELVPQVSQDCRNFGFASGNESKGNARKLSGSYYTPESLVQVLLNSALEPVVNEALASDPARPEEALLNISVVDPACGSGHFLLASARRLASHLARIMANGTPSAADYRKALRKVVGRCVYGVDLNPLAVELCKVSLWMEAVEPGRPLSFLNSHIRRGNALLGATPELMESRGIPDEAWEALEGDDKKVATALKKRNKKGAGGQRGLDALWSKGGADEAKEVALAVEALEGAPDDAIEGLRDKERRWKEIQAKEAYRHQRLVADAWCAAFVWPKQTGELSDAAPVNEVWRQVRDKQGKASELMIKTVEELAGKYSFFHWHLEFPTIFGKGAGRGGFGVVLGNPPWERVKVQEQEFFASRSEEIAKAVNAAARKRLINQLPESNPILWREWSEASRKAEGESHFVRNSGRYPLCGKGDVNTYALFAEHNRSILGEGGRAGFIVPSGIATDDTTKDYFKSVIENNMLASIFHFENADRIFPGVHASYCFVLMTLTKSPALRAVELAFYARQVGELADVERQFTLSGTDFATLNPNTRTCPTFRSKRDAEINLNIYRRAGILWKEDDPQGNPWQLRFMAMFHMANDSGLFQTRLDLMNSDHTLSGNRFEGPSGLHLPLIEAKMIHHYDHRYGTYENQSQAQSNQGKLPEFTDADHADPHRLTLPDYWVSAKEVDSRLEARWNRGWLLGWRDICRSTDQRTVIACVVPRVATGDTFLLAMPDVEPSLVACLYANLCSFALDYCARQKVGGTHLKYHTFKQLPVLPPSSYLAPCPWDKTKTRLLKEWIIHRVLELTYTAWDLKSFATDLGFETPPFRWNPERRFVLRAELDAAFFWLYQIEPADIAYILDTFSIVRKNDEKAHGHFRTKTKIMEIYQRLQQAAQGRGSFQSELEAAPGEG